jgi:hypothetical protein
MRLSLPLADSVRYPPGRLWASQPVCLRLRFLSKARAPCPLHTFRPSAQSMDLLCPRLTSANPSRHLTASVAHRRIDRSPRVMRIHLHTYACSSGQCFACGFLQIPPRNGHPCRPANSSSYQACKGLAPSSKCALPGAPKEKEPCSISAQGSLVYSYKNRNSVRLELTQAPQAIA